MCLCPTALIKDSFMHFTSSRHIRVSYLLCNHQKTMIFHKLSLGVFLRVWKLDALYTIVHTYIHMHTRSMHIRVHKLTTIIVHSIYTYNNTLNVKNSILSTKYKKTIPFMCWKIGLFGTHLELNNFRKLTNFHFSCY